MPSHQDQHANTRGPACQHTRTNMPTHKDQPQLIINLQGTQYCRCPSDLYLQELQNEQETLVKIGWRMEIWQEETTKALSVDGVNTPGPACQHTRTHMPTHQEQHAPYFVSCSFSMEYIHQNLLLPLPELAPPLSLPYWYYPAPCPLDLSNKPLDLVSHVSFCFFSNIFFM